MDQVAPLGSIYQAGTLSGNPVAMTAGYETLKQLTPELFAEIEEKTSYLCDGLRSLDDKYSINLQVVSKGTMFGFFFSQKPVRNFEDSKAADHAQFARLHGLLLEQGIYLAPSQYETNFMSSAHSKADLDQTLAAFERAFHAMKEEANG